MVKAVYRRLSEAAGDGANHEGGYRFIYVGRVLTSACGKGDEIQPWYSFRLGKKYQQIATVRIHMSRQYSMDSSANIY
jgi:hypothetical protein